MITRERVIAAAAAEGVLDTKARAIADRLELFETVIASREQTDMGLWIDDPAPRVLSAPYLTRLRALPLSHVAVMIERSGAGLDLTWTAAQLEQLASALPDHRIVLTLWPEPTVSYMQLLGRRLPALVAAAVARAVEFDLEGHWKIGKLSGFPRMGAAGDELVRIASTCAAELEVTTFPAHLEASVRGSVRGERRLFLQTYSVAEARGETREWASALGPDRRPYEDVLRIQRTAEPTVEICAGLAAWEQSDWPGEPIDAMRRALDSARRAGVRRVRWWSSRHVLGASANSYAAAAIESFRALSLRA